MSDEHPGYLTAAQIIRLYGLSASNVYRLASRNRWRKYRLGTQIRYHYDDVCDTMMKRST